MGTTKAFKSVKLRSKKRIVVKKTRNINCNKWNNAKFQTKILLIPKPNFNQHLHKRSTPICLNSFETAEGKEGRNRLEPLSHLMTRVFPTSHYFINVVNKKGTTTRCYFHALCKIILLFAVNIQLFRHECRINFCVCSFTLMTKNLCYLK